MQRLRAAIIGLLGAIGLGAFVLLSSAKNSALLVHRLAQPQNTAQQIHLPQVSNLTEAGKDVLSQEMISTPTVNGVSLPLDWQDKDPAHPDIEPAGTLEPEPFNTPIPYIPVPTPDLSTITIPELDSIRFVNPRPLTLPSNYPPDAADVSAFYGNTSWSPDSKRFVGYYSAWAAGLDSDQLYIGDTASGDFSLWVTNGAWPVWSRNNDYIYYLSPRLDDAKFFINERTTRPFYDLLRQPVNSSNAELLLRDVAPPYDPKTQLAETESGELLILDRNYELVLLPKSDDLVQITAHSDEVTPLAHITHQRAATDKSTDINPPVFATSPDGKFAIIISQESTAQLIDLHKRALIGHLRELGTAINVAWSPNNQTIAYTNNQGLFVYTLETRVLNKIVDNGDLGFPAGDLRHGVALPVWLDDQVILFVGLSPDWVVSSRAASVRFGYYLFATTSDGRFRKALGNYSLESISPNKQYALLRAPEPKTGNYSLQLFNIHHQ